MFTMVYAMNQNGWLALIIITTQARFICVVQKWVIPLAN